MTDLHFGSITGLTVAEEKQLHALAEVFIYHQTYNDTKDKYYEGHITLNDVNIGIALPCQAGCATWKWAATGARKPWMCWLRAACLTVL